jgi:hypothetical protein
MRGGSGFLAPPTDLTTPTLTEQVRPALVAPGEPMSTKVQPALPDRLALRALYDAAVAELNASRNNILTTGFYAKTGDAVFNAGYLALSDAVTDTRRMHTVSAPAGGGKTSFSYALVTAVTRYAGNRPEAPYGAVIVVDQIEKADKVYRDLSALLPRRVAVWTSDHDTKCKRPEKIERPAARYGADELRHYPVIVVTHKFYLGSNGHKARNVMRDGFLRPRMLTVVDERPDEAPTLDIMLSEAQAVREALIEAHPETKEHLDALLRFMERYSYEKPNKLYRPGIEVDPNAVTGELGWFNTAAAERSAMAASKVPGVQRLFSFAKALVLGRACVATSGAMPYFFGYEEKRVIDLSAGTILLDATADIDGISNIVPWRIETETPKARYDNLEIIHVPQHTKVRLNEYLKKASHQRAYVDYVVGTIKEHMQPGEKGLVICKKCLFDAERIPQWPDGDPRFKEPKRYTEEYEWDIEGRKLCAAHWGTGIGSNVWREADVVFLFDEFHIPRRIAAATTQGLRGHRAHEGDLGSMRTLNSKARGVDLIADGHVVRWTKQLALRGRARSYDENGACGKQRLVVGSDLKRLVANAEKLFPGARIRTVGNHSDNTTLDTKILELLNKTPEQVLSTRDLSKLISKPWRSVSRNVLTEEFLGVLSVIGWRYVSLKGPGGSRFERIAPIAVPETLDRTIGVYGLAIGTRGVARPMQ